MIEYKTEPPRYRGATQICKGASRSGTRSEISWLQSRNPWLTLASATAFFVLLAGCGREPDLSALTPVSLNRSQSEALQRMNAAGASIFAGWTWSYEFGAGCRLRVLKRYEDRPTSVMEYPLLDHRVEVIPYAGAGFGVKAYPREQPGSADLFDARTEPQAAAFAVDIQKLLTACSGTATSLQ
jgi:hypothetical protein